MLAGIHVPRRGFGRTRTRPDGLIAGKGYSPGANRDMLTRSGIKATIPKKDHQLTHRRRRGSHGGRPYAFDPTIYLCRDVV